MLKTIIFFGLFIIGVILLGGVIRIVGIDEIAKEFLKFSPWGIIPLLAFSLANQVMAAVKWQYILRAMNIQVGLFSLFKISFVGYAMGYITPVAYIGGELFRGYLLRERHNVSWQKALSSIGIDKIVEASVWAGVIFIGVILYLIQTGISSFSKTVIIGAVATLFFIGWLLVIYIFSFRKKSLVRPLIIRPFRLQDSKSEKFLDEFEGEFFSFFSFSNRKYIFGAFRLAVIKNIFLWLRNVFLIYFLAQTFSYTSGIIALSFSYIAYSLPIPAALGAHEAMLSFIFSNIGFTAETGAVFTFLMRGADMLMVSVGLIYLFKWGVAGFAFRITKNLIPKGRIQIR